MTRRDLLVAGIGIATGVVTTTVTNVAVERLGPSMASSDLDAFPAIQWSPDGSFLFYAEAPVDLSDQPERFGTPEGGYAQEAIDYLVARGCVRSSPLIVNLHFSRPGTAPAVIRDIRLINHRRAAAPSGASYHHETAGANSNTVLAVDLDANSPVLVQSTYEELVSTADVSGRPPAFSTTTFSIQPHLTETITVGFMTREGQHGFQLAVDYFVEGREHSLVIPTDVDLLRVTGVVEARETYEFPWYDQVYRFVRTS
ncbi:hypothetical protein ACI79C_09745 [Geodermatophilus sp. SYSU D00697]